MLENTKVGIMLSLEYLDGVSLELDEHNPIIAVLLQARRVGRGIVFYVRMAPRPRSISKCSRSVSAYAAGGMVAPHLDVTVVEWSLGTPVYGSFVEQLRRVRQCQRCRICHMNACAHSALV